MYNYGVYNLNIEFIINNHNVQYKFHTDSGVFEVQTGQVSTIMKNIAKEILKLKCNLF